MAELKSYELEKKLSANPASLWGYPAMLLLGEEDFLKEELLAFVADKLNLTKNSGLEKIDADLAKDDEILYSLETASFDDFKRVVIIYNADKIKAETCKKIYALWDKEGFPESSLPIFLADKVDGRRALWQLVKEEGVWAKFWKMFEDKLIVWTRQKLQNLRVKTSGAVAEEIVALCGNDPQKIAREVNKLALVYDTSTVDVNLAKLMVPKSTEASRFDIEDAFMMRDIPLVLLLLNELEGSVDAKSTVLSLTRYCRHALQARYYLNRRESYAIQLAELGQQIYNASKIKDWANISKRITMVKLASSIIDKIPMSEKMLWTGNRPLFPEDVEEDTITPDEEEAVVATTGKKKKKAGNFNLDAAAQKSKMQATKKRKQEEAYDLYSWNVWAQKNSIPIAKAFTIASKYDEEELLNLLSQLAKAYYGIWVGEEYLLSTKLGTVLLNCIKQKESK